MVEIIRPTERVVREYAHERSSLLRAPIFYTLRTIGEVLITRRQPKIVRITQELKGAIYVDRATSSMINITARTGE